MTKPFIVIGAGGHGRVVIDLLLAQGEEILFITDVDPSLHGSNILGIPVKGNDQCLADHRPGSVCLAMGVGISGDKLTKAAGQRLEMAGKLTSQGHEFPALVHPSATVARGCVIKTGAQIMAGAVIQTNCQVGDQVIINTMASLDHDTKIGTGSHVGPGATVCGAVQIGKACYVGTGATIINDITMGDEIFVTAGSVVTQDLHENGTYFGNPAVRKQPKAN